MAGIATLAQDRTTWTHSRAAAARFAWLVVGYNVLVIVWGALVRATGSGAGCGNHWPLCNGQVIPLAPRVDTMIEFTHRAMTGGAIVPVLLLVCWSFRACRRGEAARVVASCAGLLLLNEALLGALLVKLGYVTTNRSLGRVVLLSVHLSNTLLLLAALTLTAVLLPSEVTASTMLRRSRAAWVSLLGLLATLAVGVSGSLAALGDTLFPSSTLASALRADLAQSSPLLVRLRWVHPVSAALAAVFILWLLRRVWRTEGVLARSVVGLLALQFVLGIADVLLLAPTWLQLVHLAGADAFWIALVSLVARSTLFAESRVRQSAFVTM